MKKKTFETLNDDRKIDNMIKSNKCPGCEKNTIKNKGATTNTVGIYGDTTKCIKEEYVSFECTNPACKRKFRISRKLYEEKKRSQQQKTPSNQDN